ncbi:MAG TPA: 1-acyl-sn-glycerol-3-phosphate acyltransferase, partial [Casimicrobiaceae bacterium]|nr:1-acyl-sn-glycerol-3-phosphate acyltransferase [Casimicrobiaceae bacterium]
LWPKGFMNKRSGTVTLSIGRPIAANGRDAAEFMRAVETWIEDEVARIGPPPEVVREAALETAR